MDRLRNKRYGPSRHSTRPLSWYRGNNELKINLVSPDTQEVRFSERHPIIMRILTVEIILAVIALFAYLYVYSYKASYLSYFGIPHYYTEVTIAEMLNSSWLIVTFIEMLLFAIYGIMAICTYHIVNQMGIATPSPWKKRRIHVLAQIVCFVLFLGAYFIFSRETDRLFAIWGNAQSDFDLQFMIQDLSTLNEIPLITLIVISFYVFFQKRTMPDRSQQIMYWVSFFTFLFSLFFFLVLTYSHSVIQGQGAAMYNQVYPFVIEDGKVTNKLIVGTYQDQYLVVHLTNKKRTMKTRYGQRQFYTVDDTYQLMPIKEDGPKVDITVTNATGKRVAAGTEKQKEIKFVRLRLKYGVAREYDYKYLHHVQMDFEPFPLKKPEGGIK